VELAVGEVIYNAGAAPAGRPLVTYIIIEGGVSRYAFEYELGNRSRIKEELC
jgi:hypothetical protein